MEDRELQAEGCHFRISFLHSYNSVYDDTAYSIIADLHISMIIKAFLGSLLNLSGI